MSFRPRVHSAFACSSIVLSLLAGAQQEKHGRGYKPLPPTAEVVITVEKGFNGKPLPNASVVFRSLRDEQVTGNLEMKTDPDGRARMDLLEVGSHVVVQVLADGFATYASDFDLTSDGKQLLVKLERPHGQVTMYGETRDQPAGVQPGVQEHVVTRPTGGTPPTSVPPAPASPTGPLQTTPPANTPATTTPSGSAPSAPVTPK